MRLGHGTIQLCVCEAGILSSEFQPLPILSAYRSQFLCLLKKRQVQWGRAVHSQNELAGGILKVGLCISVLVVPAQSVLIFLWGGGSKRGSDIMYSSVLPPLQQQVAVACAGCGSAGEGGYPADEGLHLVVG